MQAWHIQAQASTTTLTSGAAHAKVPTQYSVDRNCCCMILARPTSAILAVKSRDNRMLADFRSKWTIFLECRKCRPRAVSKAMRLPSPGDVAPVTGSLQQHDRLVLSTVALWYAACKLHDSMLLCSGDQRDAPCLHAAVLQHSLQLSAVVVSQSYRQTTGLRQSYRQTTGLWHEVERTATSPW